MRKLVVALSCLSATALAQPAPAAEPTAEPTPVESPAAEPVANQLPPEPPPVTAPDGAARNYERAPESEYVRGGIVVRGIGVGLSYLVRGLLAPIRGLVYVEARWKTLTKIRNVFVNEAGTLGIKPSIGFNSDLGVNLGARAFIDNYFGAGEALSVGANTGGTTVQAYQLKIDLPHIGGAPLFAHTRVRWEENDGQYFAGIGNPVMHTSGEMLPATATATATRFSQKRFLSVLSAGVELGDKSTRLRIGVSGIFNDRSFGAAGSSASDPSIETSYDTSTLRGFDGGYRTLEVTGDIELDTRDTRGPTTSGTVIRAFAGGGSLIEDRTYAHYGAEATYYLAPFWPRRVFVGRIALEGVRDKNDDIPFTELPRLGGAGLLRGFHTDQFRDQLATIATLEYHYPIHELVSGQLFVETGKVAATYDALLGSGFTDHWHVGYGGGLIVHSRSSVKARIDIAYGDGLAVYFSTDVLDAFRKREREL